MSKRLDRARKLLSKTKLKAEAADECVKAARKLLKAAAHVTNGALEDALEEMSDAYVLIGATTIKVLSSTLSETQPISGNITSEDN